MPEGQSSQKPDVKQELQVLTRLPVVLALLTTVMSAGAMFALYTYIAPSLQSFTKSLTGIDYFNAGVDRGRFLDW